MCWRLLVFANVLHCLQFLPTACRCVIAPVSNSLRWPAAWCGMFSVHVNVSMCQSLLVHAAFHNHGVLSCALADNCTKDVTMGRLCCPQQKELAIKSLEHAQCWVKQQGKMPGLDDASVQSCRSASFMTQTVRHGTEIRAVDRRTRL